MLHAVIKHIYNNSTAVASFHVQHVVISIYTQAQKFITSAVNSASSVKVLFIRPVCKSERNIPFVHSCDVVKFVCVKCGVKVAV